MSAFGRIDAILIGIKHIDQRDDVRLIGRFAGDRHDASTETARWPENLHARLKQIDYVLTALFVKPFRIWANTPKYRNSIYPIICHLPK